MARSTNKTTAARAPRRPRPKLQTADIKEQLGEAVSDDAQVDVESGETKSIAVPTERKKREVGPATQKVIDRILDLRRGGMGYPTICKTLNDENVPTFKGGSTWFPPVVRGICLRNGVEKGEKVEAE